ncbi:MAG TPA: hypothetical protein PKK12_04510 [Candidatus Aminicenantes bacterium]|nr:hypothetical protein [Candidatus Aminicenantes bacterium]
MNDPIPGKDIRPPLQDPLPLPWLKPTLTRIKLKDAMSGGGIYGDLVYGYSS